jgi:hypothetical protein
MADALRSFGTDLRTAVAEGRMAMRETEEELRAAMESRSRPLG